MKLQLEEGIIDFLVMPHKNIRITVGEPGKAGASIVVSPREARVLVSILEAITEDYLD